MRALRDRGLPIPPRTRAEVHDRAKAGRSHGRGCRRGSRGAGCRPRVFRALARGRGALRRAFGTTPRGRIFWLRTPRRGSSRLGQHCKPQRGPHPGHSHHGFPWKRQNDPSKPHSSGVARQAPRRDRERVRRSRPRRAAGPAGDGVRRCASACTRPDAAAPTHASTPPQRKFSR